MFHPNYVRNILSQELNWVPSLRHACWRWNLTLGLTQQDIAIVHRNHVVTFYFCSFCCSVGDAFLIQGCSWQGALVRKKRKKVWKATLLCLFWTLWKEKNGQAFKDSNLTDQAILRLFMYMFLEWVSAHIGSTSLSLFDFIDWLSYKWGKRVIFLYPFLLWPCIHHVYFWVLFRHF